MLYVYGMNVSPDVIYIIRHAEKPLKPPLSGVDFQGSHDEHSRLPRGWQRSGALAVLFHPDRGPERAGLRTPTVLVAPSWGHPGKTAAHRSYQTIQGLSESLELPITSPFAQGRERELADSVVRGHSGVVLICWEHEHIPVIASSLPVVSGSAIPQKWPGDRYDVIWSFTLVPEPGPARYTFGQIPQRLLAGDAATVIPAGTDDPAGRLRSRCRSNRRAPVDGAEGGQDRSGHGVVLAEGDGVGPRARKRARRRAVRQDTEGDPAGMGPTTPVHDPQPFPRDGQPACVVVIGVIGQSLLDCLATTVQPTDEGVAGSAHAHSREPGFDQSVGVDHRRRARAPGAKASAVRGLHPHAGAQELHDAGP